MGNSDENTPERIQPGSHDPSMLRISDEDRHKVAEVLREAAGDGRIDLGELDERLEATYAAKTYADLVPITIDLPQQPDVTRPQESAAQLRQVSPTSITHASSSAIMSEVKRQGAWLLNDGHTAFALMGTVVLDLREATFQSRAITINANAIMGEVKIIIDEFTHVQLAGTPIMGEFKQAKDKSPARLTGDSPVVTVRGMALMGSVTVLRYPPVGTPRKIIGTY